MFSSLSAHKLAGHSFGSGRNTGLECSDSFLSWECIGKSVVSLETRDRTFLCIPFQAHGWWCLHPDGKHHASKVRQSFNFTPVMQCAQSQPHLAQLLWSNARLSQYCLRNCKTLIAEPHCKRRCSSSSQLCILTVGLDLWESHLLPWFLHLQVGPE